MVEQSSLSADCQNLANRVRFDLVTLAERVNATMHWGGDLSCVEILSVLYNACLNLEENNFANKDKFILSKGHAGASLYAVLFEKHLVDNDLFITYREDGSFLAELAEYNPQLGIEVSGGSLGLGLSYGVGLALLAKKKNYSYHTYVLVGDGELDEGSVWEAIMFAGQMCIDNITLIIDSNKAQSDGMTQDILSWNRINDRLKAFDWVVDEIDGHNCDEIIKSIKNYTKNKPRAIVANTIKGKGISFMEGNNEWHDKQLRGEDLIKAREEVRKIVGNEF